MIWEETEVDMRRYKAGEMGAYEVGEGMIRSADDVSGAVWG